MLSLLRDIKSQLMSELDVIIGNDYKFWVEAFCPKSIFSDISSNIIGIIERWLVSLASVLNSNYFMVYLQAGSLFDDIEASKLFSIPPLPWSIDLLIKFSELWKVAACTIIENSCLDRDLSLEYVEKRISGIIKGKIFQSIRLRSFYKVLTNFAQDGDPFLKVKERYTNINRMILPRLMSGWSREFKRKDFYERDFLEVLRVNVRSSPNPSYNKEASAFFVRLGSRLEHGILKLLHDLADMKSDIDIGDDIDDIDDIDDNYVSYIKYHKEKVSEIKGEYDVYYQAYKDLRRKEHGSMCCVC